MADQLRRRRGVVRASFTRSHNELKTVITADPVDLDTAQLKLQRINHIYEELQVLDEQVLDSILEQNLPDADLEAERVATDKYAEEWTHVNYAMTKLDQRSRPSSPATSQASASVSHADTREISTYKLPKVELKKFNGQLTEWLEFWDQFKSIHENPKISPREKFQYLVQSMIPGTEADDVIKMYKQTTDNYLKVIDALQETFGKPKALKRVYIRELLSLVINNTQTKVKLSEVFNKLQGHLHNLETLGISSDQMDVLLFPLVESSLPSDVLIAWQRSSNYGRDENEGNEGHTEFQYLMEFLKKEVDSEKKRALAQKPFTIVSPKEEEPRRRKKVGGDRRVASEAPTAAGLFSGQGQASQCVFCEKNHPSEQCGKATSMTIAEKEEKIRQKNVCFSCLKKGHGAKKCKSFLKCPVCSKKHHALLCPELPVNHKDKPDIRGKESTEVVATNLSCSNSVLLNTLSVRAIGKEKQLTVRILLDEGAQRSYIREITAKRLQLTPLGSEKMQKALFGGQTSEVRTHKKYDLTLESLDGRRRLTIRVLDEPTLCGRIPRVPKGSWVQELADNKIQISDLKSNSDEIDVVIGSDCRGEVVTFNGLRLSCGLVALETRLGWALSGPLPSDNQIAMAVTSALFVDSVPLTELWNLETLGIRDPIEAISKEEKEREVAEHFAQTVKRNEDGRYSVSLPWLDGEQKNIPSNRTVAEKRLRSSTQKLQSSGFLRCYDELLKTWEEEGFVEEVNEAEDSAHFLPHRAVLKPKSPTTPVRPVFDASCKLGRTPSLNECLQKGPNLMELIPAILLRFREKRVGVTSDIRKAFQMIEVAEKDRKYLRFLWWEDLSCKRLKVLQHRRVVFGVNSSPFLLHAVVRLHLSGVRGQDKDVAEKLLRSLYVDNCVTSVETLVDYQQFRERATKLMQGAQMELRQWEATGDVSGVGLPTDGGCRLETGSGSHSSVLGLVWDRQKDTLCLNFEDDESSLAKITKRQILSRAQRIFDPIGFSSPVTLQPKLMLQELWHAKLGWDQEVDDDTEGKFRRWVKDVHLLKTIRIPRQMLQSEADSIQLHTFGDASKLAYAAVVFVRTVKDGKVKVGFAQAKSRVSPLNKSTIPRLELMASLIGARLQKSTKEALKLEDITSVLWSDSTTALAWIRRNDEWGSFVGNRVREITNLTKSENWKYVPGSLNPADLPSRGCSPRQLLESKWWEGPRWLQLPPSEWPSMESEVDEKEVENEKKKVTTTMAVLLLGSFTTKFQSYLKNVRVIGWVRRFIFNSHIQTKERNLSKCLSMQELRKAENDLLRIVQKESFPEDVNRISGISVTKMEDGLIHVKSRLLNKEDTTLFKWPVVLPNSHPLVEEMVLEVHRIFGHLGAQSLLGRLRERFWLLQGRRTVRRVLRRCHTCRRHEAKPLEVDPAALPEKRVNLSVVFGTTGVDLAGPLLLKNGKKTWVVLYTCAVYRCVHLDLVSSLSTETFLDSLERFVNLFGRPRTIYSDNGTNFVGAVNLFKKLNWKKIEEMGEVRQIQWIFNPPTAAWWGGWWERLIRSSKDLLKRMLGKARLTEDKLRTCLSAVEAALNNRPLTTITEDVDDLIPLTPMMFLRGVVNQGFPEGKELSSQGLRDDFQTTTKLYRELQTRFRKEYLAQLVQRAKERRTLPPRVGDIVLVGADDKKRLYWPMGRIIQLIPGKDGHERVAKVKTKNGILVRPLQRLYSLEVPHPEETPFDVAQAKLKPSPPLASNATDSHCEEGAVKPSPSLKTRAGRAINKPLRFQ